MYYTVETIGPKRERTPEGFLLCLDVPIARTGTQLYGDQEVPIKGDADGLVTIHRDEAEVFREQTIASFMGKPVTNDHPEEGVNPENWRRYAVGVVQNVRRGAGMEDDLLLADMLLTDKEAIDDVMAGKREVSCGYDSDYENLGPGRGRQINIIGNHVALVDKGRCGSRCAIGDRSQIMKPNLKDRIKAAFSSRDAATLDAALDEIDAGDGTHVHVHTAPTMDSAPAKPTLDAVLDARLKKMEDALAKLAKDAEEEEEEEKKKKKETEDKECEDEEEEEEEEKKRNKDALSDLVARAEILSPGFKVPTTDCACTDRKKATDARLAVKRRVLDSAYRTDAGQKAINPFLGGRTATFDALPASVVDAAFIGAAEVIRLENNRKVSDASHQMRDFTKQPMGPAEINAKAAKFWDSQNIFKKGA